MRVLQMYTTATPTSIAFIPLYAMCASYIYIDIENGSEMKQFCGWQNGKYFENILISHFSYIELHMDSMACMMKVAIKQQNASCSMPWLCAVCVCVCF